MDKSVTLTDTREGDTMTVSYVEGDKSDAELIGEWVLAELNGGRLRPLVLGPLGSIANMVTRKSLRLKQRGYTQDIIMKNARRMIGEQLRKARR